MLLCICHRLTEGRKRFFGACALLSTDGGDTIIPEAKKDMRLKILARITKLLLMLLMLSVACAMAALVISGDVRRFFAEGYGMEADGFMLYAFLLTAGAIALWILFELIAVLSTVESDPFLERNARAFVRMGVAAEIAAALFVGKCVFSFTAMTAVCALVMALSGLFALTLAAVFARAVAFKQENDLTI